MYSGDSFAPPPQRDHSGTRWRFSALVVGGLVALVLALACKAVLVPHRYPSLPSLPTTGLIPSRPALPAVGYAWRVERPVEPFRDDLYDGEAAAAAEWSTEQHHLYVRAYRFDSGRRAHDRLFDLRYPRKHLYGDHILPNAQFDHPLHGEAVLDGDDCSGSRCARWVLAVRYGQYVVWVYNDNRRGAGVLTSKTEMEAMAGALLGTYEGLQQDQR